MLYPLVDLYLNRSTLYSFKNKLNLALEDIQKLCKINPEIGREQEINIRRKINNIVNLINSKCSIKEKAMFKILIPLEPTINVTQGKNSYIPILANSDFDNFNSNSCIVGIILKQIIDETTPILLFYKKFYLR